jgi:CheY-like chemotaxis protein
VVFFREHGRRKRPRLCPSPDVVLLDYEMGQQTGADFLDWLRVKKQNRSLPVVMFTSSLGQRHVEECYANGANHFLRKPTNLTRLREIIGSLYLSVLRKSPEPLIHLPEYIGDPRIAIIAMTTSNSTNVNPPFQKQTLRLVRLQPTCIQFNY